MGAGGAGTPMTRRGAPVTVGPPETKVSRRWAAADWSFDNLMNFDEEDETDMPTMPCSVSDGSGMITGIRPALCPLSHLLVA